MKVFNISWLASAGLCLSACLSPQTGLSARVVQEPLADESKSSVLKFGLAVVDATCARDASYDPGCTDQTLPVFTVPNELGVSHSAAPVLSFPADTSPYDCSVVVESAGTIPFTFDPGWRSTCVLGSNSYECQGVPAVANLSASEEAAPPLGVQAVLTLSCLGYQNISKALFMSNQAPLGPDSQANRTTW